MAAAQVTENYGDEWSLTWYVLCSIYTSISTWTHEDHPNQHENSHKLCDEMGHPAVLESQWKLRQQRDQNFPKEGNPL